MGGLYPEVAVVETGMLVAGDENLVYWETSGNPTGKPALVIHGGPGSGSNSYFAARLEGTGSLSLTSGVVGGAAWDASHPTTDLSTNTTAHLLGDIELLRDHLEVESWLLFGLSWGSTLGLAYAEMYPEMSLRSSWGR